MVRKHAIKKGFFDVPLLMAATVTVFSALIHIRLFLQIGAQRLTARNTASTFLELM